MTTTTLARNSDPITSKIAGSEVEKAPGTATLQARLLRQFGRKSQTAEMAGLNAGLEPWEGGWKRVSELKKQGLIEYRLDSKGLPLLWQQMSGKRAHVYKITAKGREVLKAIRGRK